MTTEEIWWIARAEAAISWAPTLLPRMPVLGSPTARKQSATGRARGSWSHLPSLRRHRIPWWRIRIESNFMSVSRTITRSHFRVPSPALGFSIDNYHGDSQLLFYLNGSTTPAPYTILAAGLTNSTLNPTGISTVNTMSGATFTNPSAMTDGLQLFGPVLVGSGGSTQGRGTVQFTGPVSSIRIVSEDDNNGVSATYTVFTIPEPSRALLSVLGFGIVFWRRIRRS